MRAALVLLISAVFATSAAPCQNVAEQYLFAALNQERAANGLSPLQLDSSLSAAAQNHAEQMAAHRTISHRFPGEPDLADRGTAAGARFSRIAENVAEGPTPRILHNAWMRSPGHRDNILDPHVNAVGIAVVLRHGQLYAVQDFAGTTLALPLSQQEVTVAMILEQSGLDLIPQSADARAACAGAHPATEPGYLIRYTTADLTRLPASLTPRLASGAFHAASVGACTGSSASPFTAYNLAILLYR